MKRAVRRSQFCGRVGTAGSTNASFDTLLLGIKSATCSTRRAMPLRQQAVSRSRIRFKPCALIAAIPFFVSASKPSPDRRIRNKSFRWLATSLSISLFSTSEKTTNYQCVALHNIYRSKNEFMQHIVLAPLHADGCQSNGEIRNRQCPDRGAVTLRRVSDN
jgi:hypothetical protein